MNTVLETLDLGDNQNAINIHVNFHCFMCFRFRKCVEYYQQSYERLWECHNPNMIYLPKPIPIFPKKTHINAKFPPFSISTIFVLILYVSNYRNISVVLDYDSQKNSHLS